MINTEAGGPAEEAGVKPGDRLMWINGVMAAMLTHSALMKMVLPASAPPCSNL